MSRKIATLWDKRDDDDREHSHPPSQPGQAFYAGGSEHSGQQILGPSRDDDDHMSGNLIENLFNNARRSAAAVSEGSEGGGGTTLPITFWRNGFTVGDEGSLREYSAAENRNFLDCLRRGETPPELVRRVRGGMIDVKLENRATQDYRSERRFQPFAGTGHRLGAPTPPTVTGEQQKDEARDKKTDS